jgi:glycosyltransferase involved in cell wall biosynthesis
MKTSGVSVIIPNFNHGAYLKQRIDSVLSQTYQNFEVIILDDCSSDDSRDVIESYRNFEQIKHIVYNDKNGGSAFLQWKKGVDLASGEFIWIAESDDFADTEFLETLMTKATVKPSIGLAYCQSWVVDQRGVPLHLVSNWIDIIDRKRWTADFENTGKMECSRYLITQNTIFNASSVIFKKHLFLEAFELNGLKLAGDWLLWSKILMQCDLVYIAKPLNYFRKHAQSVRSSFTSQLNELNECCYVVERMRKEIFNNPKGIKIAYKICVNRVLSRLMRGGSLTKKQLKLHLKEELNDIPVELSRQINYFVASPITKRLYKVLPFLIKDTL